MTRRWLVDLPGMEPLSANDREHHMARAGRVAAWREAAGWMVKADRVPPLQRVVVGLVVQPPDRRRRDPSNLMPTQKAAVDGMVDAGVVPDDTPAHVTELVPRFTEPGDGWRLWLEIVEGTP